VQACLPVHLPEAWQAGFAKTVTTVPAVAFFERRSFSEVISEGWAY